MLFPTSTSILAAAFVSIFLILTESQFLVQGNSNLRDSHLFNEPLQKTIKVESGDVYDCIDLEKQPSLSHPFLENHIIQRHPSLYPQSLKHKRQTSNFHLQLELVECPNGTIPVFRKPDGDLNNIIVRSGDHHFAKPPPQSNVVDTVVTEETFVNGRGTKPGTYFGAKASLNVWQLSGLYPDQLSSAFVSLTDTSPDPKFENHITVGWMIYNSLYNDYKPRFSTSWQGGFGRYCYNLLCPGFVQVSSTIALGATFRNISIYDGPQYYFTILIFKDPVTHNWWLTYGNDFQPVGYWPNTLFRALSAAAPNVKMGGLAVTYNGKPSPEMGSGRPPEDGFRRAAFIRNIQIADQTNTLVNPRRWFTQRYQPDSNCYVVGPLEDSGDIAVGFYYGGRGGC